MKTLKSFIRSVSPFQSAANKRKTQKNEVSLVDKQDEESDDRYGSYEWDISQVNILSAVTKFYVRYNPEKVHKVELIVQKFKGDEIELLRELCKRYKLEQKDMKAFLDSSPQVPKMDVSLDWPQQRSEHRSSPSVGNRSARSLGRASTDQLMKVQQSKQTYIIPVVNSMVERHRSDRRDDLSDQRGPAAGVEDTLEKGYDNTENKNSDFLDVDNISMGSFPLVPSPSNDESTPGRVSKAFSASDLAEDGIQSIFATATPTQMDEIRDLGVKDDIEKGISSMPATDGSANENSMLNRPLHRHLTDSSVASAKQLARTINSLNDMSSSEQTDVGRQLKGPYGHRSTKRTDTEQSFEDRSVLSQSGAVNSSMSSVANDNMETSGFMNEKLLPDSAAVDTSPSGLQEQLERAQRALSKADADRYQMLSLLEIVSARSASSAPIDVRGVINAYLNKYSQQNSSTDNADNKHQSVPQATDRSASPSVRHRSARKQKTVSSDDGSNGDSERDRNDIESRAVNQDQNVTLSKREQRLQLYQQRIREEELASRSQREENPFGIKTDEQALLEGLNINIAAHRSDADSDRTMVSKPSKPQAPQNGHVHYNYGGSAWSFTSDNASQSRIRRQQSPPKIRDNSPQYMQNTVSSANSKRDSDPTVLAHASGWANCLRPADGPVSGQRSSTPRGDTVSLSSQGGVDQRGGEEEQRWGGGAPDLNAQYSLAKQFYLHGLSQAKISQRLALGNLAHQEQRVQHDLQRAMQLDARQQREQAVRDTSPFKAGTALASAPSSSSSMASSAWSANDHRPASALLCSSALRQQHLPARFRSPAGGANAGRSPSPQKEVEAAGDDWVECFDPKNRRCYYHSASLRKSTWQKPVRFVPLAHNSAAAVKGLSSRGPTPSAVATSQHRVNNNGDSDCGGDANEVPIMSTTPTYAQMQAHNSGWDHGNHRQRSDSTSISGSVGGSIGGSVVSIRSSSVSSSANLRSSSPFLSSAHDVAGRVNSQRSQRSQSLSPSPLQQHQSLPRNSSRVSRPSSGSRTSHVPIGGGSVNSSLSRTNSNSSLSYSALSTSVAAGRAPSPAPSQPLSTSKSTSMRSGSATKKLWATAVDPVSQRVYWYNRETRESVWKKPPGAN